MSFCFGDFELDQERRQLLRTGQPVPLEPKAYELLSLLLERRPRALSKAHIRDVIWPQTFITESTLGVVVNAVREALGDDARHPRFIRTVHGFGYAFCGEARADGDGRPVAGETVQEPKTGTGTTAEEALRPYPGLSAFTEADAEHFFGREAEVEALWEKVRRQRLLAVIGPSGVGKTSFLRAGVIPSRPSGWGVAYLTPGASPALALARALIPDLAGDAEAIGELLQGVQELSLGGESDRALSAVRRWRKKSDKALVVLDQFEELYTLNPPELQARFASFLGRLAEETEVHVLLSFRDDFLFRCSEQDGLRPVFHDLTPLTPPSPEALRRALVEPAARRGVRFEEEALVEEMVESVASERGALPLLAFAVSRLWEERDRSRKLLTREAYERTDGVAGALAQHAEATLSGLGPERDRMVREIFRNLVTAQGTRAAADRAELLSVFAGKRDEAGVVLDALVDARLLTEYEAVSEAHVHQATGPNGRVASDAESMLDEGPGVEPATASRNDTGHRRIEIVHESLLTHWPRLARWRTQDADGAQLRDQLKQAAHLWDERRRPDDLLWTGTSYLDYGAWRARYAGGLSALEEEFAQAMTALANRRKRRRRMAVAAVVAALVIGLGVVGVLWSRSEDARQRADAEALHAEASKLLTLGQAELESDPTAALAYVTKSFELVDTEEARRLAVRVLQDGPTASVVAAGDGEPRLSWAFSPDGEWLAQGGPGKVRLFARDGREAAGGFAEAGSSARVATYEFDASGRMLVGDRFGDVHVWTVPDGREVRRVQVDDGLSWVFVRGDAFWTFTTVGEGGDARLVIRRAPLAGGDPTLVGTMSMTESYSLESTDFVEAVDATGTRLAYVPGMFSAGTTLYVRSLQRWASPPRRIATHPAGILGVAFHPEGRQVAVSDRSGRIAIWPAEGGVERPLRIVECAGAWDVAFSPHGRWLAARGVDQAVYLRLWDLTASASLEPLRIPNDGLLGAWFFDPSERWLAAPGPRGFTLWPLGEAYPRFVGHHDWFVDDVAFTPDGSTLVSAAGGADGTLRARSLAPGGPGTDRVLLRTPLNGPWVAVDPRGGRVAVSEGMSGRVFVVPLAGGPARDLDFPGGLDLYPVAAFSPDGRDLAASGVSGPARTKVIRIVIDRCISNRHRTMVAVRCGHAPTRQSRGVGEASLASNRSAEGRPVDQWRRSTARLLA